MFSEVGLVMVIGGSVGLLLRRGWKVAVLLNAVPVAAYVGWFLSIGASQVRISGSVGSIPINVARGLIGSLGAAAGMYWIGIGLVAGLCWFIWSERHEVRSRLAVPVAMAISAVAFNVLTGIGRSHGEPSLVPRYFYVDFVLLTPLLGIAAGRLVQGHRIRQLSLAAASVGCTAVGANLLLQASDAYVAINQETRQYVTTAAVLSATRPSAILLTPDASIENHFFPYIQMSSLEEFVGDGVLSYDVQPTRSIELAVELQLQTRFTSMPLFAQSLDKPTSVAAAGHAERRGGCNTVATARTMRLALNHQGSLRLVADGGPANAQLSLQDGAGATSSFSRALEMADNSTEFLNSTITNATLTLSITSGTVDVCRASRLA
jgi:hypothetical protein